MTDEAPPFRSLALADLAPLFDGCPATPRARMRWPYSPFAYWLASTRTVWRVEGSGPAFEEVCALIPEANRCYERSRAAIGGADLLVLDGPWDAETTDPARWTPLLAAGAIVLLHGIHPGFQGSRLWRQWRSDAPAAPTFSFSAGSGLGLLLVGEALAPPVARALCTLSADEAAAFERACAAAAARWELVRQDGEIRLRMAQLKRHISSLQRIAGRPGDEFRAVVADHAAERARADALAHRLAAIEASHTWRAGFVLRRIQARLPAPVRHALHDIARATWTVTARLARNLRARRESLRQASPGVSSSSTKAGGGEPSPPPPTSPPTASASERAGARRRSSGQDLPPASLLTVAVGFVAADTTIEALRRAIGSAQDALHALGQDDRFRVIVADDGFPVPLAEYLPAGVVCLPRTGEPGAAARHNGMMKLAFAEGADVYVVGEPGAVFDPEALITILRPLRGHGQLALVTPAIESSAQPPMSEDFDVDWALPGGLTVSRQVHASLGDFDERMDMTAAAADLSLRARAVGIKVLRAVDASYRQVPNSLECRGPEPAPAAVASALMLAHKWQERALTARLTRRLERLGGALPSLQARYAGDASTSAILTAWWDQQEAGPALPSSASPNGTTMVDPAVLPTEDLDAYLAVPFRYVSAETALPSFRIAAMIHLFYEDLAVETLDFLRNVPVPLDLLITTNTEQKRQTIESAFAGWPSGTVDVFVVPNRGGDIAPRLDTLRAAHARYDLVLYLHGKKSLHWEHGPDWRKYLYETLLGSADLVRSVLSAFALSPALGIVLPQHWDLIRASIDWGYSFEDARELASRMGIELHLTQPLDFPSGSMFWARPAALQPLLDLGLTADDFPVGDGGGSTYAHAIERLMLRICERSGHSWIKIANPSLMANHRGLREVHGPDDLARLLRDLPFRLSDPAQPRGRAEARA